MEVKTRKFIRVDFEELARKLNLSGSIKFLYADSFKKYIEIEMGDDDERSQPV